MVTQFELYFTFLMETLQEIQDSKGNRERLYLLLQANLDKIDSYLAQVLQQWATVRLHSVNQETARSIAGTISIFSNLIQDFPLGNPNNNLEIAFTGYEVVSSVFNRQECPKAWAEVQSNLCRAYQKITNGNSIDNIIKAINAGQSALEIYSQEPNSEEWAATYINLGNAYFFRVDGDVVENLQQSIECYGKALSVFNKETFHEQWAVAQNSIGTAYLYKQDNIKANLEQAIKAYKLALKRCSFQVFSKLWADIQNNMCIAYSNRIIGCRVRNKELAIIHAKLALKVRTRKAFPALWADTQNNLGSAYCERVKGNRLENLGLAVESYKAALKIYIRTVFPERWARTQNNLGTAYSEMWQPTLAIECFRSALEIYEPATFPVNCFATGRNFGFTAYKFGDWDKAIEGYGTAIEATEQSRDWASRDSRKAEILSVAIDVYTGIVQAYINIDQPDKAIEYAERSKARNLVELLANKDIFPKRDSYPNSEVYQTHCHQLEQLRRQIPAKQRELPILISSPESEEKYRDEIELRRQELTQLQQQRDELLVEINQIDPNFTFTQKVQPIPFSDIQSLTDETTAIVEWYITGSPILTFIITCHHPCPIVVASEDITALENWDKEYRDSYQQQNTQWINNLASRLQNLAEILHIDDILSSIDKCFSQSGAKCNRLILIPHRYLHLFPLHALPLADGKLLLERFPKGVGYAPSCQLLKQAKDQEQHRPDFTSLFAIQNPTRQPARPLLGSQLEIDKIHQNFDPQHSIILKEAEATEANLYQRMEQMRSSHCLHFSCHGEFNHESPLESALLLANPEGKLEKEEAKLTLGEVFEKLYLNQCRLVTFSACESGMTDPHSISDEYIGLPSGFLYAGSPSIVSTLWSVDPIATTLLMVKFYHNLKRIPQIKTGDVAIALNKAQKWLRTLTYKKWARIQSYPQFQHLVEEAFENSPKRERNKFKDSLSESLSLNRQPLPFANPYYWSAFVASGI